MGGPSLESYRAEQKRREERRAALRTRDGVVDLAEWRAALKAAAFLARMLGDLPWLGRVRVGVAPDVGCELVLTMLWETRQGRICIPSAVDHVPVRVVVLNPGSRRD